MDTCRDIQTKIAILLRSTYSSSLHRGKNFRFIIRHRNPVFRKSGMQSVHMFVQTTIHCRHMSGMFRKNRLRIETHDRNGEIFKSSARMNSPFIQHHIQHSPPLSVFRHRLRLPKRFRLIQRFDIFRFRHRISNKSRTRLNMRNTIFDISCPDDNIQFDITIEAEPSD